MWLANILLKKMGCYTESGYHHSKEMEIEQLILPERCRQGVLQLIHTILLAGHLEKDKTVQQILYQF